MNPETRYPLARALALSLVLHAALLASGARLSALLPSVARPPDLTLKVRLADPLPVPAPQPELMMREDTPREAPPAAKPSTKPATTPLEKRLVRPSAEPQHAASASGVAVLSGEPARRAREQIARELLYPLEAIEQGLEGEVLVMLFLDDSGNAIAARVEASSGHRILDEAAVRAARTLRSLPASAPREALVPVRFRLR
jgi:protein TonB